MKYNEFRELMEEYEDAVEVFEDDFKLLCEFVIVNDIFTLRGIHRVNLVNRDCLWFNSDFSISLEDVECIKIHEVESCL